MMNFIYRWKDPRKPDPILCTRYVGMTSNPNGRYHSHLMCDGSNPVKDAWIQELKRLGMEPIMEIIEIVYEGRDAAFEREEYWINHYLDQGCLLTNLRISKEIAAKSNQIESGLTDKPSSLDRGFARYARFIQEIYGISQPTAREFKSMLNLYSNTAYEAQWNIGEEEWRQDKLAELELTGKLELPPGELLNRDLAVLRNMSRHN